MNNEKCSNSNILIKHKNNIILFLPCRVVNVTWIVPLDSWVRLPSSSVRSDAASYTGPSKDSYFPCGAGDGWSRTPGSLWSPPPCTSPSTEDCPPPGPASNDRSGPPLTGLWAQGMIERIMPTETKVKCLSASANSIVLRKTSIHVSRTLISQI